MLKNSDMAEKVNIYLPHDRILNASIIEQIEETNHFSIRRKNEHSIDLNFSYIGSKEGIVLRIIHTGSPDALSINYKIKGGKKSSEIHKQNLRKSKVILLISLIIVSVGYLLPLTFLKTASSLGVSNDLFSILILSLDGIAFLSIFLSLAYESNSIGIPKCVPEEKQLLTISF